MTVRKRSNAKLVARDPYAKCRAAVTDLLKTVAEECKPPKEVFDAAMASFEPAIRLWPTRINKNPPLGTTRLGGQPDLPDGVDWPRTDAPDETPMSFFAQVRLDEVARFDLECRLPAQGLLSFFFDQCNTASIIFTTAKGRELRRLAFPDEPTTLGLSATKSVDVRPEPEITVLLYGREHALLHKYSPTWAGCEGWDIGTRAGIDKVQGFRSWREPKHRLLGHPNLLQADGLGNGKHLLLQVDRDPRTGFTADCFLRLFIVVGSRKLRPSDFTARHRAFTECQ